MMNASIKKLN